jgi:hypothetical protein
MLEVCPPCAAPPPCLRRDVTGWETEEGEAPWNRTNEHEATEWSDDAWMCVATSQGGIH